MGILVYTTYNGLHYASSAELREEAARYARKANRFPFASAERAKYSNKAIRYFKQALKQEEEGK